MADYTEEFMVEEDTACADVRITDAAATKPEAGSGKSTGAASQPGDSPDVDEPLDAHKLAQRQKQIDFGKNTLGYQRYIQRVPKERRSFKDPATPDINSRISKRCFDGQVKAWRRLLHQYDQEAQEQAEPEADTTRGDAQRSGAGGRGRGRKGSRPRDQGGRGGGRGLGQANRQPGGQAAAAPQQQAPKSSSQPSSSADSYSSQGSLDGYLAPADRGHKKRGFNNAFQQHAGGDDTARQHDQQQVAVCDMDGPGVEHVSKRSTTSRSMDTSQAGGFNQASTAGTAHPGTAPNAPTTFSGLGLAGRLADAGARPPVPPRQAPAAAKAAGGAAGVVVVGGGGEESQGLMTSSAGGSPVRAAHDPGAAEETNVLKLILGNDSCMSWADDEPDVQL